MLNLRFATHPSSAKLSLKRPLAIALGGGGARGALQVGALRAWLECGVQPEILVGTSVGAVNATRPRLGFQPNHRAHRTRLPTHPK